MFRFFVCLAQVAAGAYREHGLTGSVAIHRHRDRADVIQAIAEGARDRGDLIRRTGRRREGQRRFGRIELVQELIRAL